MSAFKPSQEQIEEFARWLVSDEVKPVIALFMPGTAEAREQRVADIAASLQIYANWLKINDDAPRQIYAGWLAIQGR